jgi:hypothetical protein
VSQRKKNHNVASERIAVQRFFWNIGWSKIGPSRNGNYEVYASIGC